MKASLTPPKRLLQRQAKNRKSTMDLQQWSFQWLQHQKATKSTTKLLFLLFQRKDD